MSTCKVCEKAFDELPIFVINRKQYRICEQCSNSIFIRMASSYAKNKSIFIPPKTVTKPTKNFDKEVLEVANYLHSLTDNRVFTRSKLPPVYIELIGKRIEEGYTVKQLKAVAYHKNKAWKGTDKEEYIRVTTLYRPKNFARYVTEVPEDYNPENTKSQREIIRKLNKYIISGERNEESKKLVEELKATGYNKPNILNQFE